MSQKKVYPWIKPLGLDPSDFEQKPKGEDPLVWGLKNSVINEQEYLNWASSHYELPAIKPDFFSMAIDFSLVDKFANVYDWNPYCYPIYQWKNVIYVACLHPHEINPKGRFCFVISPFTPLESAWQKFQNSLPGLDQQTLEQKVMKPSPQEAITPPEQAAPETAPPQPEAAPEPAVQPVSEANPNMDLPDLDFGGLDTGEAPVQQPQSQTASPLEDDTEPVENTNGPAPSNDTNLADLSTLDFSTMGGEVQPETPLKNAQEMTHTDVDAGKADGMTTATQTMHARPDTSTVQHPDIPAMDFDNLSTGGLNLEGDPEPQAEPEVTKESAQAGDELNLAVEPSPAPVQPAATPPIPQPVVQAPPPPAPPVAEDENALPSLDDLVSEQVTHVKPAPGLEDKPALEIPKLAEDELIDDDYTPVPEMAATQKAARDKQKLELAEQADKSKNLTENTITDRGQPLVTPPEALITEADFAKNTSIDSAKDKKEVVAHFMSHLRRDYKKMMWIEKNEAELYYPKFVYGDWKMTELAWKMHINLTNPNIFRISYKSGQAFHGEVSMNPYNEKYFEWWCRGRVPELVTIHPIKVDDSIVAFIVAFDKNDEFDEIASLKKIENLISICKKAFRKYNFKAAA